MNIDYSKYCNEPVNYSKHAPFLPRNIFCVIAGSTGSGKTNLIVNFLRNEGILDYNNVYIYSSTLHQSKYKLLRDYYKLLEDKIKKYYRKDVKIAHFFDGAEEIINPSELDPVKKHIIIFDDVMFDDQTQIKEYFCKGRHNNVNIFYLCQSLHKIPKHGIRQNANMFILFLQDFKTFKYFYETHISGDMDFKEF